jgi:hypothetical protein
MAITLQCKEVKTTYGSANKKTVEVELDLDIGDIITQDGTDLSEVLKCYKTSDVLDEIGQDECESHFDLEPRLEGVKAAIKEAQTKCPHCGESLEEC